MTGQREPILTAIRRHGLAMASLRRASGVALVVGPTLTLINQFDALRGQAPFDVIAAVLTFMVPFCVSVFATVASQRDAAEDTAAPARRSRSQGAHEDRAGP